MIRLEVDAEGLRQLSRALRREEDGKQIRRDLVTDLRAVAKPAVDDAKSRVRAMRSTGGRKARESLRSAVARNVGLQAKLTGKQAGVSIKAKRITLRQFWNAPKALQKAGGWKRKTFGHDPVVDQIGEPDWFDGTMEKHRNEFQKAALDVLNKAARRVGMYLH